MMSKLTAAQFSHSLGGHWLDTEVEFLALTGPLQAPDEYCMLVWQALAACHFVFLNCCSIWLAGSAPLLRGL